MTIIRFFVTGLACILAVEAANLTSVVKAQRTTQLKLLTTVDGKSFFADYTVRLNWTAAGDFCRSFGLKLASITTTAQVTALKSAYNAEFYSGYWTSGRDVQTWRQFSWNETNNEVDSLLGTVIVHTLPLTCIWLQYYSTVDLPFHLHSCAVLSGALCET